MSPKFYIKLPLLLLTLICFSCATPDIDEGVNKLRPNINTNINTNIDPNANVAEDNEIELNTLINLPFEPEENVYKESDVDEQNTDAGKKITAVLKFKDEDARILVDKLKEKSEPFETKLYPETWFPAELVAKSQMSGDETIKGVGYNAESFYKEPYIKGTITKIEPTDYFILVLQTK